MSVPYAPLSPPAVADVDPAGRSREDRIPILGYMLLRAGMTADEEIGLRQEIVSCAADQGFRLVGVFVERDDSPGLHAYAELMDALRSGPSRLVLVPSADHFGLLPGVRRAMVHWIERETGATVLILHADKGGQ